MRGTGVRKGRVQEQGTQRVGEPTTPDSNHSNHYSTKVQTSQVRSYFYNPTKMRWIRAVRTPLFRFPFHLCTHEQCVVRTLQLMVLASLVHQAPYLFRFCYRTRVSETLAAAAVAITAP
ncbi:hypothetical protein VNO80_24059 [Phaseolus coccineus]|uniref:Uncharacterized protein n=1 Tax=Phaseolus coccineus TaxID=3886 RepID=A0AAN9QMH9_PHACN